MSPRTMQGLVIAARINQTRREMDHVKPESRIPQREEPLIVTVLTLALMGTALASALFLNI